MEEKKEEELFIPKTKHKGLKILLAILLIGGLLAGAYFLYQYKFNNPKVIINTILDDMKENNQEIKNDDINKNNYRIDGHLKIAMELDGEKLPTDILKDLELQFNGEVNAKDSIANIKFNTKYKNDKLLDFSTYYEDKTVYLLLDDIYDKYIKMDIGDVKQAVETDVTFDDEDIKNIMNSILDSLQQEINKHEVKKENATIKVNDKNIDVLNSYIELKDKEASEFIKNILITLRDDKTFTDTLTKITGEDAKSMLQTSVSEMDTGEFKGIYRINFYTDKSLLNKNIVSIRQTIVVDGESVNINVDKLSDDEVLFTISYNEEYMSLKLKQNDSTFGIVFNEEIDKTKVTLEININYEKVNEITKPDVSNNIDMDAIPEKDQEKIQKKLMESKNVQKLIEDISKFSKQEA